MQSRKHWLALAVRVGRLFLRQPARTSDLVRESYDRIAGGYDDAWTHHMRGFSREMLDRLAPPAGAACLDLTCGTGFLTGELAGRTGGRVVGVDASSGMIASARKRNDDRCTFVQADALDYLVRCPPDSFDVVTCGWGLGYTRPLGVIGQIARVLRPHGCVGIIDNTLFSLAEVLWASILTFAERPEALTHVMRVRFLPGSCVLAAMMRLRGLAVSAAWDGSRTYYVRNGPEAVERLLSTGAAAGFEFAAGESARDAVFDRFARIVEERHKTGLGVPITHRYLAVVGKKR